MQRPTIRFRLAALLFAITVLSLPMVWYGNQVRRQTIVNERLRSVSSCVVVRAPTSRHEVVSVTVHTDAVQEEIEWLRKARTLEHIDLNKCSISNQQFLDLASLPRLKQVDAFDIQLSGNTVEQFNKVRPDIRIHWDAPPQEARRTFVTDRYMCDGMWASDGYRLTLQYILIQQVSNQLTNSKKDVRLTRHAIYLNGNDKIGPTEDALVWYYQRDKRFVFPVQVRLDLIKNLNIEHFTEFGASDVWVQTIVPDLDRINQMR